MENLDEQFILLDHLMEPPTVEQELELEKKIRWFTEGASKEQLICLLYTSDAADE